MLRRLLPREESFFDFFEQHAALTVCAAKALTDAGRNVEATANRIKDFEHQADAITHRTLEALYKTFITPLERNDIHKLITGLDNITDRIDGAARLLSLYEVNTIRVEMQQLAAILVRAAETVEVAVKHLRDMKHSREILAACADIKRLEKQGDQIYANAIARLFKEETSAIEIIKWQRLYDSLENALDQSDDVGRTIEGIVLELI